MVALLKKIFRKRIVLDSDISISNDGVKGSITYAKPNFNYTDNTLFTSVKSTSQDNLKLMVTKFQQQEYLLVPVMNNMKIFFLVQN